MNKSEEIADKTILPYGSISISAKEQMGISTLKQAILHEFQQDFLFCTLFIPYTQMHVYNANKPKNNSYFQRADFYNDLEIHSLFYCA